MTTVTVNSTNRTKKRTAVQLLKSALQREQEILKVGLIKTENKLTQFEKKYGMSSQKFFELYQKGKTDDRNDYIDWAGEFQIYQSLKDQMEVLEEIRI
jgi:IS4 transposase